MAVVDPLTRRVVLPAAMLLGAVLGAHGPGCVLPVETKVGCEIDDDCVGTRICIDGRCSNGACTQVCLRQCETGDDCGLPGLDDCVAACSDRSHDALRTLPRDDAVCKEYWGSGSELDCSGLLCDLYCGMLCEQAHGCDPELDEATCEQGCGAAPPGTCDPEGLSEWTCGMLEHAARCAEARADYGTDVDCNDLPCEDDYDCESHELCEFGRCLQRCSEDYECPNAECSSDHCTDPVGTPCDPEESFPCGGGYCINVDDQNRTTAEYYCTILCVLVDCPPGYTCFDYECRECAGGCSCPYQNDGECDEPEGTGYCAEGTDSADC